MNNPLTISIRTIVHLDACDQAAFESRASSDKRLRHAQHHGAGTRMAAAVVAALASRGQAHGTRIGLICTGGPWNYSRAREFATRNRVGGPAALNPLDFPGTLVSTAATAPAAVAHAHAFSFVVGYDHFAFFEVLHLASQMLKYRLADSVFAVAICASDLTLNAIGGAEVLPIPTVGIGITLVAKGAHAEPNLHYAGLRTPHDPASTHLAYYHANLKGGRLHAPFLKNAAQSNLLSATGATLLLAAKAEFETNQKLSTGFAVTLQEQERRATIVLEYSRASTTSS
jgi:hypothetical protein